MPLDVARLLDSDLFALSTGDEFKAAVALWAKSWHQVPAASVPDDERVLARLAGVSLSEWRDLSERVLDGWARASDGRLYHPVVAEKAAEAWVERLKHRKRSAAGNSVKYGRVSDGEVFDREIGEAISYLAKIAPARAAAYGNLLQGDEQAPTRTQPGSSKAPTRSEKPSEGRGRGIIPVGGGSPEPIDPGKESWSRAVGLLVRAGRMRDAPARAFFGKLLKAHGVEARDLLPAVVRAEGVGTQDPQSYLTAAAKALAAKRGGASKSEGWTAWTDDEWTVALAGFCANGEWLPGVPKPGEAGCPAPTHLTRAAA